MNPTPAQAAAKGAALLDEEAPGWAERIDLPTLDLGSCWTCVLGQIFAGPNSHPGGPYFTGLHQLGLDTKEAATEHGFAALYLDEDAALGEAWTAEILRRVQAGEPA